MQTEKLRQRLVRECPEFNTVDAFRLIDVNGRGEVDNRELKLAMQRDIRAECTDEDIDLFFKRFDKDQKGAIKYSEFCDAFVPKSQTVLNELTSRVPRNIKLEMKYPECFNENTRALYKRVWEQLFKSEYNIEMDRQKLLKNPTFDIQKAYMLFADPNSEENGNIKRQDLGRVLELDGPYRDILFARFNKRM